MTAMDDIVYLMIAMAAASAFLWIFAGLVICAIGYLAYKFIKNRFF